MKNILLVGDSIRIGYDKSVKLSLEGKANVYFPEENCRFATFVLRYLHEYKKLVPDGKVDILHWNGNIWKLITSVLVVILNYVASKLVVFRKK